MSKHVPGLIEAVVTRALAVEPRHRFATAEELRDALEAAMSALATVASHSDVARYVASLRREVGPRYERAGDGSESDATSDDSTTSLGSRGKT
jgi:hypothetical protein